MLLLWEEIGEGESHLVHNQFHGGFGTMVTNSLHS
jgi:hypothetical protein